MTRKTVNVVFYRTANDREPVKDWLLKLDKGDRSVIGTDLKTVEYGWQRRETEGRVLSEWEQENDTAQTRWQLSR
ncbi:hypothetical protein LCGC14_0929930 [marine sediment metagenome]|uniref:Uncharacterized protein n=1 Tax=marine sediment metagenome TaxID=412755 RepID=A0A0F9NNA2_9ZZZZ|nr:hypothetical protein [Desulfobacterales bacterium]